MKNTLTKTLKNISILILIAVISILTACGQLFTTTSPAENTLEPLVGEKTSLHLEMLTNINEVRTQGTTCNNVTKNSIPTVSWNDKLAGAAKTQVKDILKRSATNDINLETQAPPHVDSAGNYVDTRARAQDYNFRKVGEILASVSDGSPFINGVIKGWQASPSHCEAIMIKNFTEAGVYFESGIWAVVFGKPF